MTTQFIQAVSGNPISSADHNSNWLLAQESLSDFGAFVVTGLVPSAGAGLAVTVTAGTAVIGARVTAAASFSIAGLSNGTVNHLYLRDDGIGVSNTSGTQPADSVKIGTATTAGGVVTSVNILRSSGRQLLVRHENLVPGAVGSPGSLNLASWNATAGDGFSFYGVLPAGALPSSLSGDVTLTPATDARNKIVPTLDTVVGLEIGPHSATQSDSLFTTLDAADNRIAEFLFDGSLQLTQPLAGSEALKIFARTGLASSPIARVYDQNTDLIFELGTSGWGALFSTTINDPADRGFLCTLASGQTQSPFVIWDFFGNDAFTIDANLDLNFYRKTTTNDWPLATSMRSTLANNVLATYTGRGRLIAKDFNAERECIRWEASGAAAMVGFLGAAAVVRPASTTDLRAALINLGLYTTGGASPLDLNGGTLTANRVTTPQVDIRSTGEIDLGGSAGTAGYVLTSQGAGVAVGWSALPADTDTLATLTDVTLSGVAQGDVIYRGASAWNNLVHGTSGQVLISGGASANPSWSSSPTLGALTLGGDLTLSTHNLITDTSTGTQIATGATQKLGFFGATPVVQISGSTDILAGWVTLGLRAASSNPPLDMGTGLLTGRVLLAAGATGAGTAPLKMQSGSLMTSPEAGAYEFLTPGLYATPVSTRRRFILSSDVKTSDTTVANTVVETTVFTGTIAANELAAGMVLRVYYSGDYSTANATDTFTINHKVNGVTFISQPSSASSQTQTQWFGRFTATCRTAGGSGSMVSHFEGTYAGNAKNTRDLTVHTVDTTGALNVTVTVTWSNALSGNTITCRQAYLEML